MNWPCLLVGSKCSGSDVNQLVAQIFVAGHTYASVDILDQLCC